MRVLNPFVRSYVFTVKFLASPFNFASDYK